MRRPTYLPLRFHPRAPSSPVSSLGLIEPCHQKTRNWACFPYCFLESGKGGRLWFCGRFTPQQQPILLLVLPASHTPAFTGSMSGAVYLCGSVSWCKNRHCTRSSAQDKAKIHLTLPSVFTLEIPPWNSSLKEAVKVWTTCKADQTKP